MAMTAGDRPDALKHSGTFNGNPVTAVAGLASLRLLDAPAIASLNEAATSLASRIEAAGADAGIRIVVSRYGSIMHVHFREAFPENAAQVRAESAPAAAALHLSLLVHGVYAAPRGMLNLSTALSSADLEDVAAAYRAAIADVVRAGLAPRTLTAQTPA
jgi:glutamate-1-semialdehyde 2,1-aminomutase